jgi:hypothetical protein
MGRRRRDLEVAAAALSAFFAAICFAALPQRPAKPAILLAWIHVSAIVDAATDCSEELKIAHQLSPLSTLYVRLCPHSAHT